MQKFMRFPEWKTKAMTLSYDDAVIFDERLIAIMQKYGLKGTFNVNGGMLDEKFYRRMGLEQAVALYKNSGMEVAMHGLDHAFLEGSTGADILKEYYEDKLVLEKEFGKIMRGGAYAFGVYNDEIVNVLKTLGLSYFRTTKCTDGFEIPKDWLRWQATCRHGASNLFELLDKFLAAKPDLHYSAKPLFFALWGHSYEFEDSGNWEIIERFGEKVSAHSDIWHATNAEIYDYTKAYESLIFSAAGDKVFNPSPVDIYLWANRKRVIAKANAVTELE
jgi:peptidoglycan/xylan/chitin deacetylase (PgdA/CDA1 family)